MSCCNWWLKESDSCLEQARHRADSLDLFILSPQMLHILDKCFWLLPFAISTDALTAINDAGAILASVLGLMKGLLAKHEPPVQQGPDPCVCFRNQRGKKTALIGDLAGPCQSHMYPLEDAKRTLAHATSNNKKPYSTSEPTRIRTVIHSVTTAEHSNSAIVSI